MEFDKRFIGDETIKLIEEMGCEPIEMTEEQKFLFNKFLEKFAGLDSPNGHYDDCENGEKRLSVTGDYIHNFDYNGDDKEAILFAELSISFEHNYGREATVGGDCIYSLVEKVYDYNITEYGTETYTYIVINDHQVCDVGIDPYE